VRTTPKQRDLSKIARRVKEAREAAGLSQLELASRAGTCITSISVAERGGVVGPVVAGKLAAALGLQPGQLS
jgi:transcriptional regulator with XRE-family HTH domain